MSRSVVMLFLAILTICAWNIDTGPLNFLWLVMLVVDFWAVVALVGYEMILGIVKAVSNEYKKSN